MNSDQQTQSGDLSKDGFIRTGARPIQFSMWDDPNNQSTVIIAAAMGVSRKFYKPFAAYLYDTGYNVISFDYFGMEHDKGRDQKSLRLVDWGKEDIKTVIDYALQRFGKPVFLCGHSIGGQILPMASNKNELSAAFLVASSNISKDHWSGKALAGIKIFWYLVLPVTLGILGFLPGFAYGGRYNLSKNIALDWRKWGTSVEGILGAEADALECYQSIRVPAAFVSIEGDNMMGPRKGVEALYQSYGSTIKEHRHIDGQETGIGFLGHFDFFREKNSKLWLQAHEWFQQNL